MTGFWDLIKEQFHKFWPWMSETTHGLTRWGWVGVLLLVIVIGNVLTYAFS